MHDTSKNIVTLTVPADMSMLAPTLDYIEALLKNTGITPPDVLRMRLGLEEASVHVIEHAFDPGEEGSFDIILQRRPNKIALQVRDKGLPVDFRKLEQDASAGLGLRLIRGIADEVQFLYLGKEGKCIELVKELPCLSAAETLSDGEKKELEKMEPVQVEQATIALRFMTPDDASAMARCVYRSYGYTYAMEAIYYPDRIRENLASGLVKSVVAVDENTGEIVGHLALTFPTPGAKVADSGQAVVDPRYRGHNIFKDMKKFMVEYARTTGMFGIYSEAVTTHAFTQKGNLSIGAFETGFLLCFVPDTMHFKKIQDVNAPPVRQSAVLFYLRTNPEPERTIYPPARHAALIEEIYQRNTFRRTYGIAPVSETPEAATLSTADLLVHDAIKRALITVSTYGADFAAMLRHRLALLIEKKIELIFLDLPLSDPATATRYEDAEKAGFFFVGVMPEIDEQGDYARFLFLNGVTVEPDKYVRVSDFVQKLFDYIMAERARYAGSR